MLRRLIVRFLWPVIEEELRRRDRVNAGRCNVTVVNFATTSRATDLARARSQIADSVARAVARGSRAI